MSDDFDEVNPIAFGYVIGAIFVFAGFFMLWFFKI